MNAVSTIRPASSVQMAEAIPSLSLTLAPGFTLPAVARQCTDMPALGAPLESTRTWSS